MPKLKTDCAHCGCEVLYWPSRMAKYCSRSCWNAANVSTFDYAAWHAANRADQNAKKKAWCAANREKRHGIQRAWRERNKEKIAAATRLRRSIYATGATRDEVAGVIAAAEGHCTYCDRPVDHLELDHVEPVAAGGPHTLDNFIPACRTCNASKSDHKAEEWIFAKFGIEGLARAVVMLEQRRRVASL